MLRAPSVSAESKTLLEVNINFEDNESDSYKSGKRDFQIQSLQKKPVSSISQPAKEIFSYLSDGDIEQTLSNINASCYLCTISTRIKGSTVSLYWYFEEKVYRCTSRDRAVYFAVIFVNFIEKWAFKTDYNFCQVIKPKRELQQAFTSFALKVSSLHVIQCLKYSDKYAR